jgi:zinc transporter ZupT
MIRKIFLTIGCILGSLALLGALVLLAPMFLATVLELGAAFLAGFVIWSLWRGVQEIIQHIKP